MFTGRLELLAFADQLISEFGGSQVERTSVRPVLIIEGYGGSGRTAVLDEIRRRWHKRTMMAQISARVLPPDSGQSLLSAIVFDLALGTRVPGFEKVSFDRFVLAHVAMSAPVTGNDPQVAAEQMRQRLTQYRDRGKVQLLVQGLADGVKNVIGAGVPLLSGEPVTQAVAKTVADTAARTVVGALQRSKMLVRHNWGDALAWFGHQDQGLDHDPVAALVRISQQAAIASPVVRRDIDDLLVAALLADLRAGMARVANRRTNAVLLIDDADAVAVTGFVGSLLRVRQDLAQKRVAPDPLTVILTSGGGLATAIGGPATQPRVAGPELGALSREQIRKAGSWLPVILDDLAFTDVERIVDSYLWPPELGTAAVADAVYQFADGHAAATTLAIRHVFAARRLPERLDVVLGEAAPDGGHRIGEYLLGRAVAGLGVRGSTDERVKADLITLAAARDRDEAEGLLGVLYTRASGESALACPALWPQVGSRGRPTMPRFLRNLLLRSLGERKPDAWNGWRTVFTALLDGADEGDRLHHLLALRDRDQVVEKLAKRLETLPGDQWLALLDRTVVTPALDRPPPDTDERTPAPSHTVAESIALLVHHLHVLTDPRITDPSARAFYDLVAAHEYTELASACRSHRRLFILRAQEHRRRAGVFA